MAFLMQSERDPGKSVPFWRNPLEWIRQQKLSRKFWVFFAAAFFFDAGFAIYFFLFNLYLLDHHFSDRSIGLIGGAMTLGSLVGILPAGMLARKIGVRSLLAFCFVAAPAFCEPCGCGSLRRSVWGSWQGSRCAVGVSAIFRQ
jgi:MFS family permease